MLFGRDPSTGRPRKLAFSARALLPGLRLLARGKALRGTALDAFGGTTERKRERLLRDQFLELVDEILSRLDKTNFETAISLASYPEEIRGFGSVKEETVARVQALRTMSSPEHSDIPAVAPQVLSRASEAPQGYYDPARRS